MINLSTIIKNKVNSNHCGDDNRICLDLDELIGLDGELIVAALEGCRFDYLVFNAEYLTGTHLHLLRKVVDVVEFSKVVLLSAAPLSPFTLKVLKALPILVISLGVEGAYEPFNLLSRSGELNMLFNQFYGSNHLNAMTDYETHSIASDDILMAACERDEGAQFAIANEYWDCNLMLLEPGQIPSGRILLKVM